MEVVGFVAAVVSIVKVGKAAGKFANTIYRVSKEAGTVGDRIKGTALLFESFDKSMQVAHISIEYRCPQEEDSPVIKYIQDYHILEGLKSQSDNISRTIREQREKIWSVLSWWNIITSWRWRRMKPVIDDLHPQMESMKTQFMMVLQVITLEVTVAKNKERPSEEYEKEIKYLKRSIEQHVQTIEHLRREHQLISVALNNTNVSVRSLSSKVDDQFRAICHLGQSFVETEAVPTQPPETFSFKEVRRREQYQKRHSTPRISSRRASTTNTTNSDSRRESTSRSALVPGQGPIAARAKSSRHPPVSNSRGQENDYVVEEAPSTTHVESVPMRHAGSQDIATSPHLLQRTMSSTASINSHGESSTRKGADTEEIQNDTPIELHKDSKGKQKQTYRTIVQDADPSPPQTPTSQARQVPFDFDPRDRDTPRLIHRRIPSGGGEISRSIVAGYIANKSGRRRFEAHEDRQLLGNLITEKYAKELGLSIEKQTRHTIPYRDGEIVTVGKVALEWSTRSTSTLVEPGSIDCTVCEELVYPLIFGSWFSKAARYMSREEGREIEE